MSASKFFSFGTGLLRSHRPVLYLPPILFSRSLTIQPLRLRQFCSSLAVDGLVTESSGTSEPPVAYHPWPEWVTFVDRLETNGYLAGSPSNADSEDGGAKSARTYMEMNILKDPCISFARDRYDIFQSLPVQDIQAVVEYGCPNLLRKVVNSSKRLRVHVQLDEGDVCSSCNLRGSCDKAYGTLKESETAARTVDIVRLLLAYALDPLVISGHQKPPGRELAEVSARKLLLKLVELSETSCDPSLPIPAPEASFSKKQQMKPANTDPSKSNEIGRGDWMCPNPKCNFLNFSKNIVCRKCKEDRPKQAAADDVEMKKGDWICSECQFMNFSRNISCLRCKAQGPKKVAVNEVKMKPGDWNCPKCSFMNFASNKTCLRCRENRPKVHPGDWDCPSCGYVNYRGNEVCRKCNHEQPKGKKTDYEEQLWQSPY